MDLDRLAALRAVVDHGSFESAARALHVTPSAVSQRIKALEHAHGRVLVVRGAPCRATADGEILLRFARQVGELEADAMAALHDEGGTRRRLSVVVNADSLATWFGPVVAEAATWDDVALDLVVEVEDEGTAHLRSGAAVGAVTSDPVPVPGCAVEPLGVLRYVPVAAPGLLRRHRRSRGVVDWAGLPCVRFDASDDLQHRFLRRRGVLAPDVLHHVPDNHAFREAIRAGLGWGLLPEAQAEDDLTDGTLERADDDDLDVSLTWQRWRLGSDATLRLGAAIHRAARAGLHEVPSRGTRVTTRRGRP